MPATVGNAELVRTGPGRLLGGAFGVDLVDEWDDPIPSTYDELGFTTSGTEITPSQDRIEVPVAERLRPIRYQSGASGLVMAFTLAQSSPQSWKFALPGGKLTTTTGGSTRFDFPKQGSTDRATILWEHEDGRERLCLVKGFVSPSGSTTHGAVTSGDPAGVGIEVAAEEVTGGQDAYMLWDPTLAPAA